MASRCPIAVSGWSLVLFVACLASAADEVRKVRRVVVVPDIHGDVDALNRSLALAGIPGSGAVCESTTLVSLGDVVDRGPFGWECHMVLDALARDPTSHGLGKVIRIYGNHDWVNLLGVDSRDDKSTPHQEDLFAFMVHPEELMYFGRLAAQQANFAGSWAARKEAFAPSGILGQIVTKNFQLIAQVPPAPHGFCHERPPQPPPLSLASTLFVHAGLSAETAGSHSSAEALAAEATAEVLAGRAGESLLFDELTQDRHFAEGPEDQVCEEVNTVLGHFCAARIVVGHTPTERLGVAGNRVAQRCGGRLVLLDVGMSRWIHSMTEPDRDGHPAVMELTYDDHGIAVSLVVLYEHGRQDKLPLDDAASESGEMAPSVRAEL